MAMPSRVHDKRTCSPLSRVPSQLPMIHSGRKSAPSPPPAACTVCVAAVRTARTALITSTRRMFFGMCVSPSPARASAGRFYRNRRKSHGGAITPGKEKAHIILRPATMPRSGSTGEPVADDVSALLRAWSDGDPRALARLTPIVYDELRRLARYHMKRERAGHSLQTTALVNEAYMRLVDYKRMQWQNRAH